MPGSLQSILEEAAANGVQQLACNGCWQEDWARVAAAARSHPQAVVANFGVHPWWVPRRSPDWLQQLRRMLLEHPQAGLGEVRLLAPSSVCHAALPACTPSVFALQQQNHLQEQCLRHAACSVGWTGGRGRQRETGRCSCKCLSSSCSLLRSSSGQCR